MFNLIMSSFSLFMAILLFSVGLYAEEAKYVVVHSDDDFEVRYYDSHILAEVSVIGDFEDAGSDAFRPLFDYISGENIKRQKVSMTAPVSQQEVGQSISMTSPVGQVGANGSWVVSFMMPAEYSLETVPKPINPQVTLRLVPARYVASVQYSGFWSEEKYQLNYNELLAWIDGKNFKTLGSPIWARYNAPYTPWFLRRNEILFPIEYPPI